MNTDDQMMEAIAELQLPAYVFVIGYAIGYANVALTVLNTIAVVTGTGDWVNAIAAIGGAFACGIMFAKGRLMP